MLSDLKNYCPKEIEFNLSDKDKEMFGEVLVLCPECKSAKEVFKKIKDEFNATFPNGENAERKYDNFEVTAIREEYCVKQENEAPKRKTELECTLAQIKQMKKDAEEAYNSVLLEIADLAAKVKNGLTDYRLSANDTMRIALNGHYLTYSWVDEKFQLCKVQPIPPFEKGGLWAQEDTNRKVMLEEFGIEFPEVDKPVEEDKNDSTDNNGNDLPFGDDDPSLGDDDEPSLDE